ncbi:MAG TPA: hypothetical protein VFI10_04570 [Gaiellaceae bacterium]|nr:hypothetical protein [Gaiellaceae bacterium]
MALRLRLILPAVLAAAAFSVPAANAGLIDGLLGTGSGLIGNLLPGNCPSGGSQVFGAWGDYANYYLAPNGSFEFGTNGWALSGGAGVVRENEPFYPTGSHSLGLPSGSSALSPTICLGPDQLYVRMFAKDLGGRDSGLRVRVRWYGLLNQVLGLTDYAVFEPGSDWSPTSKLSTSGGFQVPLVPLLGSTSARIEITPLGRSSRWQIDDVYVDPCIGRIG